MIMAGLEEDKWTIGLWQSFVVSAGVSWYNLQLLVNFAPQTVCFLSVYSSTPSKFKPIKTNLTPLDFGYN